MHFRRRRLCLTLLVLIIPLILCGALWLWAALAPPPSLLNGAEFSTLVYDRHGQLMRMGLTSDEKYRVRLKLGEISPDLVRATLLYEDRRFYSHCGIDFVAVGRAAAGLLSLGGRGGASTITMQTARLAHNLHTQSLGGKLWQLWMAFCLERHYSKEEILEAYFNLAPYGGNVEGAGAAARVYFGVEAARLSRSQALALAAVPQNPVARAPLRQGVALQKARELMARLWADHAPAQGGEAGAGQDRVQTGAQTPAQTGAKTGGQPEEVRPLKVRGPASLPRRAAHVSAEALRLGQERVYTTLDPVAQEILERGLRDFVRRGAAFGLHNAAALLVHWPSMEVRGLVGSADFDNAGIGGQVDGTRARRSPGSTLKPLIYALGLDQGLIHARSLLVDAPRSFRGYDPENFDRLFRGPLPAEEALRASRNIPSIWLASRLKPSLYEFLQRAGADFMYSAEHYGLALVLGGAEVTMRQLAEWYAMLPGKGLWRPLRLWRDAGGGAGTSGGFAGNGRAGDAGSGGLSLLSPEAAHIALRMLEEPGRSLRTREGTLPLRYKTGTSNRFRDAWTVGVLGPYVLAVWVGNFDNSPNPLLVGGEVAAPLFEELGRACALALPMPDLLLAQEKDLNITRLPVCAATGDTDVSLCPEQRETWFIPGISPTKDTGILRRILVDQRHGWRLCGPPRDAQEESHALPMVREFWPSDLARLFALAGLDKPAPPPFAPWCGQEDQSTPQGLGPRILTPREGLVYVRAVGNSEGGSFDSISLSAAVEPDASEVYWFVGREMLGRSAPGEVLAWRPGEGTHTLRAVDNLGRASTRTVEVRTVRR